MAGTGSRRRATGHRRRLTRRSALSEINVTPLVDVMLVLLIIFMISAPLLNSGIPLELPKTQAGALDQGEGPVTLSIQADGSVYLADQMVPSAGLVDSLLVAAKGNTQAAVFVRADGNAPYRVVAEVMGKLSAEGFTRLNLVTDVAGIADPTATTATGPRVKAQSRTELDPRP